MAWEENPRICLHMQLIAILSRTEVYYYTASSQRTGTSRRAALGNGAEHDEGQGKSVACCLRYATNQH